MLRAVLFDYGLTLVTFDYPRAELTRAMEEARAWLPPPAPSAERLVEDVLLPLEDQLDAPGEREVDYMALYAAQWRRAGFDLPRPLLERLLDHEQRVWDGAARPAAGAHATLAAVRARGLRTGLVSNAPFPPHLLRRQLEHLGLAPLLDAVVFSSEVGYRKPSPVIYETALRRVGAAAAEALFVGDRADLDYDAPRALGMRALICTELARRPVPPGVATIATLDGLLEHL